MRQSAVAFKCGHLTLEGVVASPQEISATLPGVVVCHPHPLFGGDMNNSLVLALCQELVEAGFVTLRFNFRGVGNSDGSFTKGEEEQEDVGAALRFLGQWPGVKRRHLGLAGYSFGASVVLSGLSRYKGVGALVLISPPLTALDHPGVGRDRRPKLFIVGDSDKLVPYSSLKEKVSALQEHSPELRKPTGSVGLQVVKGADHAWLGYEAEVAQQASQFFGGTLPR